MMQDGIFRSTDRGVRWTGWNFGLYDSNINALAVADSQVIFTGTQSGIFCSTNAGVPA
jgi:ligand-binding sensor domain-containing protein